MLKILFYCNLSKQDNVILALIWAQIVQQGDVHYKGNKNTQLSSVTTLEMTRGQVVVFFRYRAFNIRSNRILPDLATPFSLTILSVCVF